MYFNRLFKILMMISVSCLVCSCRDQEAHREIRQLKDALEAQERNHEKVLELISERDFQINRMRYTIGQLSRKERFETIDPSGVGFSILQTNNGRFFASCKDASQYLDGHKLTVDIGNPYSIHYTGFSLTVKFGTRPPELADGATSQQLDEWAKMYDEWERKLVVKNMSFTEELRPGAWTRVDLILSPSRPEEVAYISVSMSTNQVSLLKAR